MRRTSIQNLRGIIDHSTRFLVQCAMERSVRSVLVFVAVSILISSHPTDAWYKQSTGPSYYSVGRASGLLSGIRRSPYVRRSETESALDSSETPDVSNSAMPDFSSRQTPVLKNMVNYIRFDQKHRLYI